MPPTPPADVPRLTLHRDGAVAGGTAFADAATTLETLVARLEEILLRHPVAAQAAFAALVREGRRFGATEEGARWRAALADSELVRRGRTLWESSLLNMLEDDPDAILPSGLFDAVTRAFSRGELGDLVQTLLGGKGGDGHHR